jgi:hypothetical protein
MKWDRREALWQAHRAFRLVVIIGCCFAALDYALDETQGMLAAAFVIVGAVTVGVGWAKVWREPENRA